MSQPPFDEERSPSSINPRDPPASRDVDVVLGPLRQALAELMRSKALNAGDTSLALPSLTEVCAELLDVDRASVWFFRDDDQRMECADLYERSKGQHSKGTVLEASGAPRYFRAIAQARSLAAVDAQTDPRTSEFTKDYLIPCGIGAMLDAPVLLHGKLVGVVCHEHVGGPRAWRSWEELVAGSFADFVGMVLAAGQQRAQALELERHKSELEHRVDERTAQLRRSEESVRKLFAASPVALVLCRPDGTVVTANEAALALLGWPERAAGRNLFSTSEQAEGLRALIGGNGAGMLEVRLCRADGTPWWAGVGLSRVEFEGEGALLFGLHDLTPQKTVEDQLRVLAETDALTGALSRGHFLDLATQELVRSHRYDRPLSLLMLDADHFKKINDTHGHAVGDEALCTIVRAARGALRASDVLGRLGGEEFAILLPETGLGAAVAAAERVRAAVGSTPIPVESGTISVRLSVGATERAPGDSLEDLFKRADAALYAAKAAGRDRVETR